MIRSAVASHVMRVQAIHAKRKKLSLKIVLCCVTNGSQRTEHHIVVSHCTIVSSCASSSSVGACPTPAHSTSCVGSGRVHIVVAVSCVKISDSTPCKIQGRAVRGMPSTALTGQYPREALQFLVVWKSQGRMQM